MNGALVQAQIYKKVKIKFTDEFKKSVQRNLLRNLIPINKISWLPIFKNIFPFHAVAYKKFPVVKDMKIPIPTAQLKISKPSSYFTLQDPLQKVIELLQKIRFNRH